MLTQTAVREYWKEISEEMNSINFLYHKTLCTSQHKHIESCQFEYIDNTEQSFDVLGDRRQERKCSANKERLQKI
jgi:hypothetical protein